MREKEPPEQTRRATMSQRGYKAPKFIAEFLSGRKSDK